MSDLKLIKNRLRDYDKIEKLLEKMGCEYVKMEQGGDLVTAMLPPKFNSSNKRALQVRMNDSIYCQIRNRGDFNGGSIFDLVSYIQFDKRGEKEINKNLPKSKEYICKTFGWEEYLGNKNNVFVKDYTASLKELIGGKRKRNNFVPNEVISESILNQFYIDNQPVPYYEWVKEGIPSYVQRLYGIGFDLLSRRVTIPLRNTKGQLVGVKGRTVEEKDKEDRKYLYLYRCNNRYEWFNFYIAKDYIIKSKKVFIFESEKSVMKAVSYGYFNCLSIGATDISSEQSNLLNSLGEDIEKVLCYDKDKTIDEVTEQVNRLGSNNVYAMIDTDDFLEGKDAPVDKGKVIWENLVDNYVYELSTEKQE
jgi:DNA primase